MTLLYAFFLGAVAFLVVPFVLLVAGYILAFLALAILRLLIGSAPSRYP